VSHQQPYDPIDEERLSFSDPVHSANHRLLRGEPGRVRDQPLYFGFAQTTEVDRMAIA
jgi:hypothetical protein